MPKNLVTLWDFGNMACNTYIDTQSAQHLIHYKLKLYQHFSHPHQILAINIFRHLHQVLRFFKNR